MKKRRAIVNKTKIKKLTAFYSYSQANAFLNTELDNIHQKLRDKSLDNITKHILKKYAIISLVSLFERFFTSMSFRIIDKYKIPISNLLSGTTYEDLIKDKPMFTNGQIVASSYNFDDPNQIDWLFTNLLGLNLPFFELIDKMDRHDPYRNIGKGPPTKINWNEFRDMFRLRHDIVHGMADVTLSNTRVTNLCDWTINIVDAATALSNPETRSSFFQILQQDGWL